MLFARLVFERNVQLRTVTGDLAILNGHVEFLHLSHAKIAHGSCRGLHGYPCGSRPGLSAGSNYLGHPVNTVGHIEAPSISSSATPDEVLPRLQCTIPAKRILPRCERLAGVRGRRSTSGCSALRRRLRAAYSALQWESTKAADGTVVTAADPTRYTITFSADNSVQIRADCNRVLGTYTVSGASLSIKVGPSTLVGCPPDSHADDFLAGLEQVQTFGSAATPWNSVSHRAAAR